MGTTWPLEIDTSPARFTVEDHIGQTIVLTENRWFEHICRSHPELGQAEAYVEWAATKPDFITQERSNPNRKCYYLSMQDRPNAPLHIKVVIQLDSTVQSVRATDGYIVTAYLTRRIHPQEVKLWL